MRNSMSWLICAVLFFAMACKQSEQSQQTDASEAQPAATEPADGTEAAASAATATAAEDAAAAEGRIEGNKQLFAGKDFAGSHILIAYKGAQRAKAEVSRSKQEALQKAQDLASLLRENPDQFVEIATHESDGPSASRGGNLGSWNRGQMVPEFDAAIETLEFGQISEPVETGFGYHIIRRNETELKPYYMGKVLAVMYNLPQKPDLKRTPEEAKQLAEQILADIENSSFEAQLHRSDLPGQSQIPAFAQGDPFPPVFVETLASLDFGEVSDVKEIPSMGYVIFKREKVIRYAGSHILIAYQGAQNSTQSRTKEEAMALAKELIAKLMEAPDQFEALAKEHSNGPSAANGGKLNAWFRGSMVPAFDKAIGELTVGSISPEPVESPFGFHVIRRELVKISTPNVATR